MEALLHKIRQQPGLPYTIASLAPEIFMGHTKFKSLFKEHTGTSFHHWLIAQRMQLAAALLSNPDLSIKQIARRTGYHHTASFTHAFKAHFHSTPTLWRRQHKPA